LAARYLCTIPPFPRYARVSRAIVGRFFLNTHPQTKRACSGEASGLRDSREVSCLNRKEGVVVTIVVLAAFTTGVFVSASASQVLNVFVTNFPKTHVGQDPASLVTLRCQGSPVIARQLFCTRSHSDGTPPENFTVPVGTVLVVTDVSWRIDGGRGYAGNSTIFTLELRQQLSNHRSLVFISYQVADVDGVAFKDEHLTTGFVVSPGVTMEAPSDALAILYGYLVNTG